MKVFKILYKTYGRVQKKLDIFSIQTDFSKIWSKYRIILLCVRNSICYSDKLISARLSLFTKQK